MKFFVLKGGIILLIKEAYYKYIEKLEGENSTTVQAYRGKVKKYVDLYNNEDVEIGLKRDNLEAFILKNDQKCLDKYSALLNFYEFVFKDLLSRDECIFPIKRNLVKKYDEESEKVNNYSRGRKSSEVTYVSDDFDFKVLFENIYYSHLNNKVAQLTIKAIIGLGLASGFDSQNFFENKTNNYLRVNDVKVINDDEVHIAYASKTNYISEISIAGDYCKYLIEYTTLRNEFRSDSDAFFIKMWSGYELEYDNKYSNGKPSDVQNLVLYFLKFISAELNITSLKITDLRFNMVYHYLLNSKGAALNEIIRLYGFPPFVQSAFERFVSKMNDNIYYCFDFFNLASASKEDIYIDDEADIETNISILERRLRNSSKVKRIKQIYSNKCQICGESIILLKELKYSEVHHIHPLGGAHKGADEIHNMLVLCPNHHVLFDLGVIAIDPINSKSLLHVEKSNPLNGKEIIVKHNISKTCIRYHYQNIFLPLTKELEIK